MKLHLYWIDSRWKAEQRTANNYNLLVDMENKTYKVFINPYLLYEKPEDIEVKKKSYITNYIEYLKANGFTQDFK